MRILVLLLILLAGWSQQGSAQPLSHFYWDHSATEDGLVIKGPLSWDPLACDFTKATHTLRDFPISSYRGPSGKARQNPSGAYCLQLQVPAEKIGQMLHFSMIRVFGNAELWINGRRVWHQDITTGPQRLLVLHDIDSERLEVELRLRCNEAPTCGFRGALHVKDQRQGTRFDLLHYSYDLLAVTGIAACFFYHLIFAFLRRRSSTALFLSFNALALIIRLVQTGQGQLHYFLEIPEAWYWRLEIIAAFLLLPSTISLVRSVFEEDSPPFLSTLGWVISITASLFMVMDARIYMFLVIIIYVLIALIIYQYIVVSTRALRHKRSGAIIFVVCAITTIVSTLLEILNTRLNLEMHTSMQPLSYLATMIFQSVLLATRINDAFTLAENQESEIKTLREKIEIEIRSLDQKILERTTELRTIFQSISTGILWISRHEKDELSISSEYSDHLRQSIGFDIQSWHELYFFLRRMRLSGVPQSGKELSQWFKQKMQQVETLDQELEKLLGELRVFDDLDRVRHLKFKWVPIIGEGRVEELFIFVFDVSRSIELQELAHYKTMELDALRELTTLPPALTDDFQDVFGNPSLPAIQQFARDHQLQHLEHALLHLQSEAHRDKFMQAYRRVLSLLTEKQQRQRQQKQFDCDHFMQLDDWQNLPVDSRSVFQELVRLREK